MGVSRQSLIHGPGRGEAFCTSTISPTTRQPGNHQLTLQPGGRFLSFALGERGGTEALQGLHPLAMD